MDSKSLLQQWEKNSKLNNDKIEIITNLSQMNCSLPLPPHVFIFIFIFIFKYFNFIFFYFFFLFFIFFFFG